MARSGRQVVMFGAVVMTLFITIAARSAQVSNVDWEIQEVYEHYMGISLTEAALALEPSAVKSESLRSLGNVIVRSNGGGSDNRLYTGRKNTLPTASKDLLVFNTLLEASCDL